MSVVLGTVVPVFAVVALGWLLAARRPVDLTTLGDLALLVCSPALVFTLLAEAPVEPRWLLELAGSSLFVTAGTAAIALAAARPLGAPVRALLLPSVFWNSGNIALPCARLAFGPEGLEAAAIPFVTVAVLSFTAGVAVAKGAGGLREVLRLPLLYAAAAGLAVSALGVTLPRMLWEPLDMLGRMAIPLMLVNLGAQLRSLRVTHLGPSVAAVGIRMGGGVALAFAFVALFDVDGVSRQVILLHGVMPAAVVNVVLAQRYGAEPGLVASAIVLGTGASVLAIPLLLAFV